jgi:ribosomal protein L37AE/L43A
MTTETTTMRPAMTRKQQRHRQATSAAVKRLMKTCRACGRKQNPRKAYAPNVGIIWECRFCGTENGTAHRH